MTAVTGDAADSALVESLCQRALKEHGRLDFFYANAGITGANFHLPTMDEEGIMEVMRVNLLRCVVPFSLVHSVLELRLFEEPQSRVQSLDRVS